MNKYSIIYADPPWQYRDKANAGKRGACHKYPVMSLDDICQLPVASIAAEDCLLAMWWTGPMAPEALQVVDAWGFTLKNTLGFTWIKTTQHGKLAWGMGNLTRANAENVLFAVKGKPKRICAGVHQTVYAKRRIHSQKPDEVRTRLVQLMGDVPRIELFAREIVPGWAVWGNEVVNSVELDKNFC